MAEVLNLKVTLNSNGSLTANWNSISDLKMYTIMIWAVGADVLICRNDDLKTNTYTSPADLADNKQYNVLVVAHKTTTVSTISEQVKILIPLGHYNNLPLDVPQNVNATATTNSVTISFSEVKRATGYDILFNGTTYSVNSTSKTITGLAPKTSYTYSVRAKNSSKTGNYSTTKTIKTQAVMPAVPQGITQTVTESSATVSWSAVSGATGYDILFNGITYSVSGTSKTFTGLTAGKAYTYQIRSKNSDGTSNYTSSRTVTTAPKAPTGIAATSTDSSVTLTWNASSGAVSYGVKWNGQVMTVSSSPTTFSNLNPETTYSYQVCARSADGEGSYSSVQTIKTKVRPLTVPTGITKSSTENSVTINWSAVSGATGYDVLFGGRTYSTTENTKTFTSLSQNTSFSFQIRAKNASTSSEYCSAQTVKTTPATVTNLQVSSTNNSITVSWGEVTGATSYDLLFNGVTYRVTGTSKTVTGLTANTSYSYQLRVNNEYGSSSYSSAKTVKTAPAAPSSITTSVSTTSVTVSWTAVSGATSYDLLFNGEVYRVTSTSKTIYGLTPGTSYSYAVRSNNAAGTSAYSSTKTIKTTLVAPSVPTGISATSTTNSVTIQWGAVQSATSYDVMFGNQTYRVTSTSKTITGLNHSTTYYYSVRANNSVGSSNYSTSRAIMTQLGMPSVPTSVGAISTENSVTVNWGSVLGAASYDLLFDGTVYNTTSLLKEITGLKQNTNYTYAVRAVNAVGTSAYSSTKTIKTQVAAPTEIPQNIIATATEDTVVLTWDPVEEATYYEILFDGNTYSTLTTSITINNLRYWTEYEYQICAANDGGRSDYSELKVIKTLLSVPYAPTDIYITPDMYEIGVRWSEVHAADSYELVINETVHTVQGTEYVVPDLTPSEQYMITVKAKNSVGISENNSVWKVYTKLPIPTNVTADSTMNSVRISWDLVEKAADYEVVFDDKFYETTENFMEFSNLSPGSKHWYKVRAKNPNTTSDYSEEIQIRTKREIPGIPQNVWAKAGIDSICIMWDAQENASNYQVRFNGQDFNVGEEQIIEELPSVQRFSANRLLSMDTNSLISEPIPNDSKGNFLMYNAKKSSLPEEEEEIIPDTYLIIHKLTPGMSYTFQVRAGNESGYSEFSELQTISTLEAVEGWVPEYGSNALSLDGRIPNLGLDPVNPLTGAFVWSNTFLQDFGKDSLTFTLMYDSKRQMLTKGMGKKWSYSLGYQLYDAGDKICFTTPYDVAIAFELEAESGMYQPMDGGKSGYTLELGESDTYIVKASDSSEYHFDTKKCLSQVKQSGVTVCRFTINEQEQIDKITGRNGSVLTFTYVEDKLTGVTDGMGRSIKLTYEEELLRTVTNPAGSTMEFIYDNKGNLLEISDFSGTAYVTNTYDEKERLIRQQLAGRGESTASYNETGRITTFTDELGNVTEYYYDEQFKITRVKIAGTSVQNYYDADGRLVKQVDALGNITQMSYDEKGRMNVIIHPDSTTEEVVYNEKGLPVRITNRDETQSYYEYDEQNNLTKATDERGNAGIYTYDDKGHLISYQDKMEGVWNYTYDEQGHLKSARDPEDNEYGYVHDTLGRLVSHTTPEGKTRSYTYGTLGEVLKIEESLGETSFSYDENGNLIEETDAAGHTRNFEYNSMGQVVLETDWLGNENQYTYDAKGNLLTQTDPLDFTTQYEYDGRGNCTCITDKNGRKTTYTFNQANQVTAIRNAAGGSIRYTYDTMGRIQLIADPKQNQTGYTYDSVGRLTKVTNALGDSVSYAYDNNGNLLSQTDENGTVISYEYDKENRLVSITTEAGVTLFTYDKLGRVVKVRDTKGQEENIHYDGDGNVVSKVNKENAETTYLYDEAGRLACETNALGVKTFYEYDAVGNCIAITDGAKQRWSFTYDANGKVIKEVNPLQQEVVYTYDGRGMLTAIRNAKGGETTYTYDGNGNCIKVVNPQGGEKLFEYDVLNRMTSRQDEEGNKQSFTYDVNGNLLTFTDANNNRWNYTYDALNRMTEVRDTNGEGLTFTYTKTGLLSEVTDQEGAKTSYHYDGLGQLVEMADALDNRMKFTYDSLGRMVAKEDAAGNRLQYEYSPEGNLVKLTDGEGNATIFTYDALGQVLTETNGLNQTKAYAYDELGRVVSLTNEEGNKTLFTYNVNHQITSVTDELGNQTFYEYDPNGNLIKVIDGLGKVTSYTYDAMNNRIKECLLEGESEHCVTLYEYDKIGRMIKEINPLNDSKEYTYDRNGNLILVLDEEGREHTLTYDLNNRPLTLQYGDNKQVAFRYNKRGELVELKDWTGVTTFTHDKIGRLTKVKDPKDLVTAYAYNKAGNVARITYPDGSVVQYGYDGNGRMNQVTDGEGEETILSYDKAGNVTGIIQPGGSVAYSYNGRHLPVAATYQFGDGSRQEHSFTYDAAGRMTEIARTGDLRGFTDQTEFSYDKVGRIITYKEGTVTESYGYDSFGNRISKQKNGTEQAVYQYNVMNQLISHTEEGIQYGYSYDKLGNLTEETREGKPIHQYLYDAAGKMYLGRNQETGECTEYTYNGLLMRTKNLQKRRNPLEQGGTEAFTEQVTHYVNDYLSPTHNELFRSRPGFGQIRTVYGPSYVKLGQKVTGEEGSTAAKAVIAAEAIGKTYCYPDVWGSTLIATTNQGNILRYGERDIGGSLNLPLTEELNTAGLESCFGFTSYEYDPVIDKYYAKARFYDSCTGRMMGVDPIRRGLNGYPYCNNEPTDYVDPTGEALNILGGGLLGGIIGAGAGFVSSAVSQSLTGQKVDWKKAVGSAVNGAITGAVQGAMIGSGVGLGVSLAANFAAGTLGSAAEQKISTGTVDVTKAVTGGVANAVGNAIYGTGKLNSLKEAVVKGAKAGGAIAGIYYVGEHLNPTNGSSYSEIESRTYTGTYLFPSKQYVTDPRSSCGATSPMISSITSARAVGYQYSNVQKSESAQKSNGFSLGGLVKEMLIGGLTGGLASGTFYGVDKATRAVAGSIGNLKREPYNVEVEEISNGITQTYTKDLSHVTGKGAKNRNKAIEIIIKEDFPDLKLSFKPEYSPFIRTGIAQRNTGTQIGKKMFVSREELRDTILHEELHHRWWNRNIVNHHPVGSEKEELFYKTLRGYKKMRGWK